MRLLKNSIVSALSRLTSLLSVSFLLCLSQTGLAEEEVMEEQVVVGDLTVCLAKMSTQFSVLENQYWKHHGAPRQLVRR